MMQWTVDELSEGCRFRLPEREEHYIVLPADDYESDGIYLTPCKSLATHIRYDFPADTDVQPLTPPPCSTCGRHPADLPRRTCPGCDAYSEHQA